MSQSNAITVELAIIKLKRSAEEVEKIIVNPNLELKILDDKDGFTSFRLLGSTNEIEEILSVLKEEEFLEVTRSGTLGITKGEESLEPYQFDYLLLCAKICGSSHYNMQMKIIVESEKDFEKWINQQQTFSEIIQ